MCWRSLLRFVTLSRLCGSYNVVLLDREFSFFFHCFFKVVSLVCGIHADAFSRPNSALEYVFSFPALQTLHAHLNFSSRASQEPRSLNLFSPTPTLPFSGRGSRNAGTIVVTLVVVKVLHCVTCNRAVMQCRHIEALPKNQFIYSSIYLYFGVRSSTITTGRPLGRLHRQNTPI
jgi:hypothetical protein